MGRKLKYLTVEDKRKANCEKSKRYYYKNRQSIKKRCLSYYYRTKGLLHD